MDVAPNRVGPYEVRGQLGRGGMGVVLRAIAPGGAEVAVKLLNDASRGNALARFDRERRLLGDLGEACGFVPLLDAGEHDGHPFIVMPLVPGGTLRARLGQGPLSEDEAFALGHALATAAGEAHARGIVHRDLKPENVLFAGDGRPLIADLGLAKHFAEGSPSRSVALSRSGDVLGTAGYAAPEQFLAGGEASPAQDVFALGAILYECLSGEAAFVGGSIFELVAKVERGDYVPLSVAAPTASRALARVVERALSRDPAARFPDGASLARALEGARADPAGGRPRLRRVGLATLVLVLPALAVAATRGPARPTALDRERPRDPGAIVTATASRVPSAIATATVPLEPQFPASCRSFRKTPRTRLRSFYGNHAWKSAGWVLGLAYSPDGARIASCGADGFVRLWNARSGEEEATFGGHDGPVHALLFTTDGRRVVSGGADATIRIWDLSAGREVGRLTHAHGVRALALAPDGRSVAAAGDGPTLRQFDLESLALLRELTVGTKATRGVVFGRRDLLFTAGEDGRANLFRRDTPTAIQVFSVPGWHVGAIAAVAAMPAGETFATASADGRVRTWTAGADLPTATIVGPEDPRALALAPDGRRLVAGGRDRHVCVFDLARPGGPPLVSFAEADEVRALAFSPDGRQIASGGLAREVRVWDAATGRDLRAPDPERLPGGSRCALSALGRAVVAQPDGTVRVLDPGHGVRTIPTGDSALSAVAINPDGTRALVGAEDGSLSLCDLEAGTRTTLPGHGGAVAMVGLDGAARLVVTAGRDGSLRLMDSRGPSPGATIAAGGLLHAMSLSSDGHRLFVSCSRRKGWRAEGWTIEGLTVTPLGLEWDLERLIVSLAVSSDGTLLLAGAEDGTVSVSRSGAPPQRLASLRGSVSALALSLDRLTAAVASARGEIEILDVTTGRALDRIDLGSATDHAKALALVGNGTGLSVATARGTVLSFELRRDPP